MAILLALLAGAGSLANYMYLHNTPVQALLTLLALASLIVYRGRKTRKSYQHNGTRLFTFGFALCLLAFVGSAAIFAALFWHLQ